MTSKELRKEFLNFFEKRGHKIAPSSSLLPQDPSVLFTTAGMQPFKEYYLEKPSPYGANVATSQKCFRTSDIDEVGDESHLTFLEMLGNFSFGGYFKETTIKLAYEFLFDFLRLSKDKAFFTIFEGDKDVPFDEESFLIWKKLGVPENKIKKMGRADNFWGPTGLEGPCGPTTEIHFGVEVWNLVFNQYFQDKDKKLALLPQNGVDTGMGLERLAMVVQNKNSVFETDLFSPIIEEIGKKTAKPYSLNSKPYRIIADHIKSSVFLISEEILPSNTERGYVLRRVLRRAIRYGKSLELPRNFLIPLAQKAAEIYKDVYPELKSREIDILTVIQNEEEKFEKTLEQGLKELDKIVKNWKGGMAERINIKMKPLNRIKGEDAFFLYETYGFPLELIQEELAKHLLLADKEEFEEEFKKAFEKHQGISRAGAEKKFGGHGLKEGEPASEKATRLHTATHLLLAALKRVLDDKVSQKGSDINEERARFDFNFPRKLTADEIKKVEEIVNEKIRENLKVSFDEMTLEEARKQGAKGVFEHKYGERVKVYSIGEFSKEICGGPHVQETGELGRFKIVKEESSGAGIRRVRAILE